MRRTRRFAVLLASTLFLAASTALAQDWPQWRGPNRDGKVGGFMAPKTWPKSLTEKWTKPVGEGLSSPVLAGGKIYAFGRIGEDEVTTCLDAATGNILWQETNKTPAVKGAPLMFPVQGTRSTPAVAEGKVCTFGVNGVVSCLDAVSGKEIWRKPEPKPVFYTSCSPIIADGKCIVYADKLYAFDLADGAERWKWDGSGTPYGSPILMTVGGVKQVVTPTQGAVVGVALADGKQLWKFDYGGGAYQSTYATPIIDGQTVIYGCPVGGGKGKGGGGKADGGKGGAGMVAYKVEKKGNEFSASEVWKATFVPHEYNTPVLNNGLLFGLAQGKVFFCADARTGKELWKDTTARGEADGIVNAGSTIVAQTGTSELVAFEPSGKGYMEVAKYKVSPTIGYSYPILAGNRVYIRGPKDLALWTID